MKKGWRFLFDYERNPTMARERKGSIVEREGKIYARVQFVDENGKKRDLWRKAENRTHARKLTRRILNEIECTTLRQFDATDMTFADIAEYYVKNYLHQAVYIGDRKVSGVRWAKSAISVVKPLQEYFGKRKVRSITYGDIRAYKQH
jgi:hypothetical protein